MIHNKIFVLTSLLVIFMTTSVFGALERCTEKGYVITDGPRSREFKICSKDIDGRLSLKTLTCDENSFFSKLKNRCVTNPVIVGATPPLRYENQMAHALLNSTSPVKAAYDNHYSMSQDPHQNYYSGRPGESVECPLEKGRFCHTCNTLVTCHNYKIAAIDYCSCDPYENVCVDRYIPECSNDHPFICTSFGLFPDPYFCNRYHFCQGADILPYSFHCEPGMIYDAYLEECRADKEGRYHYYSPCPGFAKCEDDFQVGKMWINAQYYYVCHIGMFGHFTKTVYKCEKNHRFNGIMCVPNYTQ